MCFLKPEKKLDVQHQKGIKMCKLMLNQTRKIKCARKEIRMCFTLS